MSINVKDREAEKLVRELAALTGENLSQTIKRAVQERLTRMQRLRGREKRIERVNDLLNALPDVKAGAFRPVSEHDWLYDDNGLPH